jgi:carbon monoxide dehydrogenase subunit G
VFTKRIHVEIAKPIDDVFAFTSDARNRPQWDESVESEELTSPEPVGVGSTVRTTMRSRGSKRQLDWKITEHDPPTHQTIESTSGPFPTTLEYRLAPSGQGTSVSFSVTGDPSGLMRLLQPLVARTVQANLDSGFPRLKRLLETGSPD